MGITISDDGTQRYSFSGSRCFFYNICPVLVKTDACIVCGCQDGRVYGECGHECYVRYMKSDFLRDEFAPMRTLTASKKIKTRNVLDAVRRGRGGRGGGPVDVPAKAALLTMEEICETDKQRRQKRLAEKSGKDTFRKRMLRRASSSPDRESQEQAKKKA